MKTHDYTYNSGHHATHETDLVSDSRVLMAVHAIMTAGETVYPHDNLISVKFTEQPDQGTAIISTSFKSSLGECPIWVAIIYANPEAAQIARYNLDHLAEQFKAQSKLPNTLATPGHCTILFPYVPVHELGLDRVKELADFAKCVAGAWLEGQI